MREMLRTTHRVFVVIMLCGICGCASFPKHRVPEVGEIPPPADQSQTVNASYRFSSGSDMGVGGRREHPENVRQRLEKEFVAVLKDSGYFAQLRSGQEGGMSIKADLLNYGNAICAAIGGSISGMTLLTVPAWATDNYKLQVTVVTSQGKRTEYVLDDAMTSVFWLPLIVATPFKAPGKVGRQVRTNMYKALILKMQEDGILPPPRKGLETSALIIKRGLVAMATS